MIGKYLDQDFNCLFCNLPLKVLYKDHIDRYDCQNCMIDTDFATKPQSNKIYWIHLGIDKNYMRIDFSRNETLLFNNNERILILPYIIDVSPNNFHIIYNKLLNMKVFI